jgi:hypothetical protein
MVCEKKNLYHAATSQKKNKPLSALKSFSEVEPPLLSQKVTEPLCLKYKKNRLCESQPFRKAVID